MVEIKRTRGGQSFLNRPIGVVNVRTGAEQVAQADASLFKSISDASFETVMNMQRSEAADYLKTVNVMGDDGKLKVVNIPKGLGRYGTEAVSQELSKRYRVGFENELRQVLPDLKIQSGGKPEVLQKLFGDYLETRTKLIRKTGGEEDIPALTEIANTLGSAAVNGLRIDNTEAQNKRSILELQINARNSAEDIFRLTASGNRDGASSVFEKSKKDIEDDPLLEEADKQQLIGDLESSIYRGTVSRSMQGKTSVELNRISIELEEGVLSEETLKESADLLKIPSDQYDTVAKTFRTQSGRVSVEEQRVAAIKKSTLLAKTGGAKQEDIDNLRQVGALTEEMIRENDKLPSMERNNINRIISNPVDKNNPEEVADLVRGLQVLSQYRTEQTEFGLIQKTMGFDDETLFRIDFLLSAFNNGTHVDAVNKMNVTMSDEDLTNHIRTKHFNSDKALKKNDTAFSLAQEFENEKFSDVDPSIRKQLRPVLMDALKIHSTPSDVVSYVNEHKEKIFKTSEYLEEGVLSRYTPEIVATRTINQAEKAFTELFEEKRQVLYDTKDFKYKNMFERDVDHFIHMRPDYRDKSITKNIKLRPINARSDQIQGSYYLYDTETKEILYSQDGPLVYSTSRLENEKKQIRMIRENSREQRQKDAEDKRKNRKEIARLTSEGKVLLEQGDALLKYNLF